MVKIVWYSRNAPLPAQVNALKEIYGENVDIEWLNRKFETDRQLLDYIRENDVKGIYAVLPLEKIQGLMNTKIGKTVDWLWAEWEDMEDGVRDENDERFDPDRDYVGYVYGIGQHRRFLGFSKIISYKLEVEPLTPIKKESEENKPLTREERRKMWGNTFREFRNALFQNKVLIKIKPSTKNPDVEYVSVYYKKDTDMFEQLRPFLKQMNFKFDNKYKNWWARVPRENVASIVSEISTRTNEILENIATRTLLKYGLWTTKKNRDYLINTITSDKGGIVKITDKTMEQEISREEPPEEAPPEIEEEIEEEELEM